MSQKDLQGARADLDTVDRSVPNESNVRFALAGLYLSDRAPDVSVHQLDSWIAPDALNLRCFARAMGNIELNEAQSDCAAALRKAPKTAAYLDSLGWVYFRLGKFDKSIREFDAALKEAPKQVASLYGRGIVELRLKPDADCCKPLAAITIAPEHYLRACQDA